MKESLLQWVCCPACQSDLVLEATTRNGAEVQDGRLTCRTCGAAYPIIRSVPRFVASDEYASAFSFEWNVHRTTQLDRVTGRSDSEDRFQQSLGVPLGALKDKLVLDVGCGTGRFAELALRHGATVIGVDLSLAVDAACTNIGAEQRMSIIQGDVFKLPLRKGIFDLIYSLGVLHHTPDCRRAFEQLPPHLKTGGTVAITVYTNSNKYYVASTNFWRRFTTRLPKRVLYAISYAAVPLYYLYRIPVLRQIGMGLFPINMDSRAEWRVLDTFDCYSPRYQSYHSFPEVFDWFREMGLEDIEVREPAVTVLGTRGTAPAGLPSSSHAAQAGQR